MLEPQRRYRVEMGLLLAAAMVLGLIGATALCMAYAHLLLAVIG